MAFNIDLKNISFGYENGTELISKADLSAKAGEITAITSGVGCGKSTLLKLAAGILRPTGGTLIVDNKNFWEMTPRGRGDIRSIMAFDFQEAALIANLSIYDNLALSPRYHCGGTESEISKHISFWLERLELKKHRDSLPAALSFKLRRRVSFARAVLTGKDFFFWDDSTAGADDFFLDEIMNVLKTNKKNGVGQMIATNDSRLLDAVADKVVVLKDGKVYLDERA